MSGGSICIPPASIAVFASAWLLRRRTRGPLAALLFFVGSLFPALGFFNVYPFIYSYVEDHFQYLASLGLIAWIAPVSSGKWQKPIAIAAIVVLGALT